MARILIVEDETITAWQLQRILKKAGHVQVKLVTTGEEALEATLVHYPDLILMDIKLQGEQDGITTAQQIQSYYPVSIVYLTAHTDKQILERAMATNPAAYLIKPFRDEQIQVAIQMALGRIQAERQAAEQEQQAHLRHALSEKEILLQEVHYRIKNNLQLICSLLRLEANQTSDLGLRSVLDRSQGRIISIATIHEKLSLQPATTRLDLGKYLYSLVVNLLDSLNPFHSRITLQPNLEDTSSVAVSVSQAIACGLIIHELIIHTFDHSLAALETQGEITLAVTQPLPTEVIVTLDNYSTSATADANLSQASTLGWQLVQLLTEQLGGKLAMLPGDRTRFELSFDPTTD